eukprot:TRINITY_DN9252_c0_g1_i1.p1 TRINITY_DN9252_c0_g1~~TRINITY_DN9252_c0_g1_i1.p1  ORF type:complete len:346 (-),score=146.53 TRINITY_DN9252_c0_g1_i1:110-1147(-)
MSQDAKPIFLGFCNPLLDVSAEVPLEVFEKWEITPGNATLANEKHLSLYADFQRDFPVQFIAGGAGQNSVRAFQWMVGKEHNGWGAYIGSIGDDENGKILKESAEKEGVKTYYMVQSGVPTGTCAVLIHQKERSLIAALNAAEKYNESHFHSQEVQSLLESVKYFYVTGFVLTHSAHVVLEMAQHAVKNNKSFSVNLSAPFLIQFFWEKLDPVLQLADLVFGNESEAAALGEKMGWGNNLEEVATKLGEYKKEGDRKRVVVFTQGADKTIVYREGKVQTFQPLKIASSEIVDTNGAGDSFVGGFMSRYVQEKSIDECVAAGHYCASECIKLSGAAYPAKNLFSFP